MSHRLARVGDLLRAELSDLIRREMRDPRVQLASVTHVEVSGDLRHARIGVSALGDEAARIAAVAALDSARGFLRTRLAPRLGLRAVPELQFVLDRSAEHSQRISDLLEDLDHGNDERA